MQTNLCFQEKYNSNTPENTMSKRGLEKNLSRTQILHRGLQRLISRQQYSKLRPNKPAIVSDPQQILSRVSPKDLEIIDPQQLYYDLLKVKDGNHMLSLQNAELKRMIKRQNTIEEIYSRKIGNRLISDLEYQKILEIKLLLEAEELEGIYDEKDREYGDLYKQMRRKRQMSQVTNIQPHIQLFTLLFNNQKEIIAKKKAIQSFIKSKYAQLKQLQQKIYKIKTVETQKREQLTQLLAKIAQLRSKRLQSSSEFLIVGDDNPSGVYSLSRNKNIEQLQIQIEKLSSQSKQLDYGIQQSMDEKVKRKIILIRQIEAIKEMIKGEGQMSERDRRELLIW